MPLHGTAQELVSRFPISRFNGSQLECISCIEPLENGDIVIGHLSWDHITGRIGPDYYFHANASCEQEHFVEFHERYCKYAPQDNNLQQYQIHADYEEVEPDYWIWVINGIEHVPGFVPGFASTTPTGRPPR